MIENVDREWTNSGTYQSHRLNYACRNDPGLTSDPGRSKMEGVIVKESVTLTLVAGAGKDFVL